MRIMCFLPFCQLNITILHLNGIFESSTNLYYDIYNSVTVTRSRIETSIPRKHGPAIAGYESVGSFIFWEHIFSSRSLFSNDKVVLRTYDFLLAEKTSIFGRL